jgi:hypothetical protein
MLLRPPTLNARPGLLLCMLGGLVGTLLLNALMFLAPTLGFPFIDIPHLMGGVVTRSPTAAFWLGFWINFLPGVVVFAPAFDLAWDFIPGPRVGLLAAPLKGIAWGTALWVLSGLMLPVVGALNRLDPGVVRNPGLFALREGVLGALGLLGGHLAYGVALALVAAMGQGIFPTDTLGWTGYTKAEAPPPGRLLSGSHVLPEYPPVGER